MKTAADFTAEVLPNGLHASQWKLFQRSIKARDAEWQVRVDAAEK
jgi:hypothetical protein